MLAITIIFAILVALWGFSGSIATYAKRGLTHLKPSPRPARPRTAAPQRPRTSRPIAPAGR
jgi:hypothetical protein